MGMLLNMAEDSKQKTKAKTFVKKILRIFKKDDKKGKDSEIDDKEVKPIVTVPIINPAARFRERFEKLDHEHQNEEQVKEIIDEETGIEDNVEELEEDKKNERYESQSSQDSGFLEKDEESVAYEVTEILSNLKIDERKEDKGKITDIDKKVKCDDLAEDLKKLKLEDGKEKKDKKVRTVTISRTPIVNKNLSSRTQAHPYSKQTSQVKVVNKQTFSGGQVTEVDEFQDIVHTALKDLFSSSKNHELNEEENFNIINDFIKGDQKVSQNTIQSPCAFQENITFEHGLEEYQSITNVYSEIAPTNNILDEFGITQSIPEIIQTNPSFTMAPTNGIDQLLTTSSCQPTNTMTCPEEFISLFEEQSVYMTPPRSVNMASPLSDFQPSPRANTSSSDYTFSPSDRSSPVFNSDMETYQKIPQFEGQSPIREVEPAEKKTNLKQFKNMQKEIAASFSAKDCCQKNRKSCKDIFNERFSKFNPEERKNICLYTSKFDLNEAFGTLQQILLRISKGSEKEDLDYVIFSQMCGRVLGEHPSWFLGEFGLTLVELAVLRCYAHPVLTRFLVECLRAVKLPEGHDLQECLFKRRVDARRDNLVIACVREGDSRAAALHWLVRREPHHPPLFDLSHVNTEGYSALHVACKAHSAANPMLHTVHVLLHHGQVDLWKGDLKGGDTALHLAVSSPTCDLRLVLLLFHQEDQKRWKQLAHCNNLGSVTPIEYARCAVKSSAKQNFPLEVLEFMKKLR